MSAVVSPTNGCTPELGSDLSTARDRTVDQPNDRARRNRSLNGHGTENGIENGTGDGTQNGMKNEVLYRTGYGKRNGTRHKVP